MLIIFTCRCTGVDDGRCHSNGIDTADACCADEHSSSAGIRHTVVAERLADCLLCQQDSRCYRRSASTTGVSGGFVNLGFTPNLPSPGSNRPILAERSISTIEEETSFCTSETRSVTFPHIVGYYEVSSVRHLGSVGPGSSNGGVASRGIEHLKVAICELANKLIRENPEAPRSWARVAEALRARRLRDSIDGDDGEGISGVVNGGPMSTVDEVAAIAAVQGITDKRELNSMLQFFKAQGILLYFPQVKHLRPILIDILRVTILCDRRWQQA